jgi:hypothetical protein
MLRCCRSEDELGLRTIYTSWQSSHTAIAERDKYIARDSLSIAAKRVTEGCPGWACMR